MAEPERDGWTTAEIRFQFEEDAVEYVLSFGPRIEAIAPPELRERVARMAAEVSELYKRSPPLNES